MFKKILVSVYTVLLIPFIIKAEGIVIPVKDDITSFENILKVVLKAMLDLAIPVIVLAIVYVGFLFIKAQGNDSKLSEAKQALTWVLIGTAVVILSNAVYGILHSAI